MQHRKHKKDTLLVVLCHKSPSICWVNQ